MNPQVSFIAGTDSYTSTADTTGAQVRSYWDTVPASQRRNLAEQMLIHGQSHYPVSNSGGFGTASSIKHPDCFWCCVGAHLDCDYDFLKKLPKQKLDEIVSFARAFFRRDCYLPNHSAENGDKTRENAGTGAENRDQKGESIIDGADRSL